MKLFEQQPGTKAFMPKAVPFDKKNFVQLQEAEKRIAYIDGGNAEIKGGPNHSVQLIRTYACIWQNRREAAVIKEKPVIVQTMPVNGQIMFESSNGERFQYWEKGLMTGQKPPAPTAVAEHIRRIEEIKLAINMLKYSPEIIVLDGNLETATETEEQLMLELKNSAQKQKTAVVGLAKTTSLITDTGMGLPDALAKLQPEGRWVYSPLIEAEELSMAKLHPLGKIYLLDGNETAAHALAFHSNDAALPGYPYPLIEADNMARVTNNETLHYRLLLDATQPNDTHEILNMITRRQ